mgnify:CR=1 FL=1
MPIISYQTIVLRHHRNVRPPDDLVCRLYEDITRVNKSEKSFNATGRSLLYILKESRGRKLMARLYTLAFIHQR